MTKEEALAEAQKIEATFEAREATVGDATRCILGKTTKFNDKDVFVVYGMGTTWDDAMTSLQSHMTFLDGVLASQKV